MKLSGKIIILVLLLTVYFSGFSQRNVSDPVVTSFIQPSDDAKPWVLWYWVYGAVTREGITADLEAMKNVGIRGAYLVCVLDSSPKVFFPNPVRELTSEWWGMVNHAMKECKRLGLQLAFHVSDGFALAGGPWIKPEQSMQKVVWSKEYVSASRLKARITLKQPETKENYYRDIAVFAYPAHSKNAFREKKLIPVVSTSSGEDASFLAERNDHSRTFRSDSAAWIQYEYSEPFTLRSLQTHTSGNNYQAERLIIEAGDDGRNFKFVMRMQPPRQGWQDTDEDYTFSIPAVTARYFRFVYDKTGTEPGSEDMDAAKWKPTLKIKGIYLSDEPVINQIEAKNGSVWRVAENTTDEMVPVDEAIKLKDVINLTDKMDEQGHLNWQPDSGDWVIVRIGHTSTGHKNETAGAAKGLECDKFSEDAVRLQFNSWFGKVFEKTDPGLAKEVLKIFYIDSWEAGSQNWSKNFATEFKKRRGYDLITYLLVMTGVPLESASVSEQILHDVRETIAELVNDVFYKTLRKLADEKGCKFTAENVAPTMVSDGLLHFKTVDYPTGEFWLNSPTHDKPNDMFDAISAGHIYGKKIIQAEAFTTLRMDWKEHPGMLKVLGDRNFAMGINRMIFHVNTLNPWLDRKPGMSLNSIGLFFQRDQTWYSQSKAFVDYFTRTSALLQYGNPVADIAVFIGEEVPRRSVLPDRLVSTLPGIFGQKRIREENVRRENVGQPLQSMPYGVTHSANMAHPEDWTDALRGYKYDCFNPDALMQAKVVQGKTVMPSGDAYSIIVFPGKLLMNPNSHLMSLPVAKKILQLKEQGAAIIIDTGYKRTISFGEDEKDLQNIWGKIIHSTEGKIIAAPFWGKTFASLGVARDVDATHSQDAIAWTHRRSEEADIYFISNPEARFRKLNLSFRVAGCVPEIWDAVTRKMTVAGKWEIKNGRTNVELPLEANASVFVVFKMKTTKSSGSSNSSALNTILDLSSEWKVKFDPSNGGPLKEVQWNSLHSWDNSKNDSIRFYSGIAVYQKEFNLKKRKWKKHPVYLVIDSIYNIASVSINGVDCGTLWTFPFQLDVSQALKKGKNNIQISVANTWYNRLYHDRTLPEKQRITWTIAPLDFMEGLTLQKAGLTGKIRLEKSR